MRGDILDREKVVQVVPELVLEEHVEIGQELRWGYIYSSRKDFLQ